MAPANGRCTTSRCATSKGGRFGMGGDFIKDFTRDVYDFYVFFMIIIYVPNFAGKYYLI